MEDTYTDATLVITTGNSSGIISEPLHVTGTTLRLRRAVRWPDRTFDFALAASVGMVMLGSCLISVVHALTP